MAAFMSVSICSLYFFCEIACKYRAVLIMNWPVRSTAIMLSTNSGSIGSMRSMLFARYSYVISPLGSFESFFFNSSSIRTKNVNYVGFYGRKVSAIVP